MKKNFIILLCLAIFSSVIVVVSSEVQNKELDEQVLFQSIDVSEFASKDLESSFDFADDVDDVNGELNIYMAKFWAKKLNYSGDEYEIGTFSNNEVKYYLMNEYFYSTTIVIGPSFLEQFGPYTQNHKNVVDQFNYPITIEY